MDIAIKKGVRETILDLLTTTGTGVGYAVPDVVKDLLFFVVGAGTISGGTLVIEEAPFPAYAGTWSQIGSGVSLSSITGGACVAVHVAGNFNAVRVRISSNVTGGGSIGCYLTGR